VGRFSPGGINAITDVPGVKVGQVTLTQGTARTGVTVSLHHGGDPWTEKVAAGTFTFNGCGEATGLMWLQEAGVLETPIALTNTLSVGAVQQALNTHLMNTHPRIGKGDDTTTPVVLECDDSALNDIRALHVKTEHVLQALKEAHSGPVAEGAVGAGTGMITYEYKGGIGTASRKVEIGGKTYTVGLLLNANHGDRETLRLLGQPVGHYWTDLKPKLVEDGSVVVVVATDAPLDSRQLTRLSKRVWLGIARTGAVAKNGSGDVSMAFSTANRYPHYPKNPLLTVKLLSDSALSPLFEAVADASEEAIYNTLVAGRTTTGRDGNTVHGLPLERLKRLNESRASLQSTLGL
jgi:D-aminopeptidase